MKDEGERGTLRKNLRWRNIKLQTIRKLFAKKKNCGKCNMWQKSGCDKNHCVFI